MGIAYFIPISWFKKETKNELALGAPATQLIYQKTIIPVSNSTYDLGTTTQNWRNVYFDKVCLSGDTCRTTWPGAGSTIGTVSTSTAPIVGNLAYWTSDAYPSLLGTVATTTLTGTAPLVFSNPISVIGGSASVLTCTAASGSVAGCLSAADWTTFNNKGSGTVTSIATTWPITGGTITTTGTLGFGGLSTSTAAVVGNIPYFSGVNTFANVATSTIGAGTGLSFSGTSGYQIGGTNGTFSVNTSQNIATLSNLTSNGFVKTGGGVGTLSVDTSTYLTTVDISANTNLAVSAPIVLTNDTLSLGNVVQYPAFTYATSSAWTGTTTIPLAPAYVAETWNGVKCFTDAGTLNVSFSDGTNLMNLLNASTTVGTFTLSTNNTFTASEKRYVDIGTPASSPTKISCTISKTLSVN